MKRRDLLVTLTLFLLLGGLLLISRLFGGRAAALSTITVDGVLYGTYALDTPQEILIRDQDGHVINVAVIEEGEIYMKEASCPDQLCIKQGHLKYENRSIVCLPNRVVITVEGRDENGPDAVAE